MKKLFSLIVILIIHFESISQKVDIPDLEEWIKNIVSAKKFDEI